jgi:predicted lipoprotein
MKTSIGSILSLITIAVLLTSTACNDNNTTATDTYDRSEMLAHWADNIIIPSYTAYTDDLAGLEESLATFNEGPSTDHLAALRQSLDQAYTSWQRVSMYEIGPAEAVALRSHANTYPTDVNSIDAALDGVAFDLELISTIDQQGFPALDYLLYQGDISDAAIVERLSTPAAAAYLQAVVGRLANLGREVALQWVTSYRNDFVAASGNSATSSVDLLVNDIIFYYEKHLRAGKVGIPAGVFSDKPLPDRVESLHNSGQSKKYLKTALSAFEDFLNGVAQDGSRGPSLMDYSDYLDDIREADSKLSDIIRDQVTSAVATIDGLDSDLAAQVENDNLKMLGAYDQLQRLVPLLKIDMVQSMGVNIDFVDTDGD